MKPLDYLYRHTHAARFSPRDLPVAGAEATISDVHANVSYVIASQTWETLYSILDDSKGELDWRN